MNRRDFLERSAKTSLKMAAGWTILRDAGSVRAAPANDRVVLAVIGIRAAARTWRRILPNGPIVASATSAKSTAICSREP